MPVEKVKYAYLAVDEMDAAVAFYRDGLGLRLKFQDAARWSEFDAGSGIVAVDLDNIVTGRKCLLFRIMR